MTGVPFWTDQIANPDPASFITPPSPWDVVLMNGAYLPGIVENGALVWRKHPHRIIQKNKAPAADGENVVWLGFAIGEFDLHMVIYTPTQLAALNDLLPSVWGGKTGPYARSAGQSSQIAGAASLGNVGGSLNLTNVGPNGGPAFIAYQTDGPQLVSHPELILTGITSCLVEGFTPPTKCSVQGAKKYIFHCREFRPAKSVSAPAPQTVKPQQINKGILVPKSTALTPPSETATPAQTLAAQLQRGNF